MFLIYNKQISCYKNDILEEYHNKYYKLKKNLFFLNYIIYT